MECATADFDAGVDTLVADMVATIGKPGVDMVRA